MLPFFVDCVCIAALYFSLVQTYDLGERLQSASLAYRLLATVLAYSIAVFVFDYILNIVLVTYEFYSSADLGAGLAWFGRVLFTGVMVRIYNFYEEKLNITEMLNFIYSALSFGNYFRRKDADTREMIGTHRMKTIYTEVHGKQFSDEVLATPFDQQVTTFKRVPLEALKESKRKPPPEYENEIDQLKQKKTTDVSVSFKFELYENRSHPLLALMDRWIIDPVRRELVITIVFPSEKPVPVDIPAERNRLIERIYESLQILIDQQWFALYVEYISFIVVEGIQRSFNDQMVEIGRPVVTMRISLHNLRIRASRITTGSDLATIASIHFPQP